MHRFLLTRLLRGATVPSFLLCSQLFISTHAPLARRDRTFFSFMFSTIHFYSRASCEARLHKKSRSAKVLPHFYSRASCEARLMVVRPAGVLPVNFYSRASCEARRKVLCTICVPARFLLTRLLRGATNTEEQRDSITTDFYSRASCEARPAQFLRSLNRQQNFYSRASCEARRIFRTFVNHNRKFLLTRLLRGATKMETDQKFLYQFLLTRLLRGATPILQIWNFCKLNFYSRASCEARLGDNYSLLVWRNFYSRASCEARRSSV